ncbi:NlpC/P60 family protein [Spongiimicrobium sp. 3-5]|uniref:C40 family peptidase n=1 Tax=Spongiimicrobium sp. 3-5 TaxID=3332596 RepID=UPI00397FD715
MQYGICPLSVIPVRQITDHGGEMITQLLYGDHFKVLEQQKKWSRIRIAFDNSEGWVSNDQITLIQEADFKAIEESKESKFITDLVAFAATETEVLIPLVIGSNVGHLHLFSHRYEGAHSCGVKGKDQLVATALLYLNAPHLKGGKTPFGLDCSGFAQMVYRINGHHLLRSALEQSTQGEALSFIEESEAGDLAFFDDKEGTIDHVGIILKNNYIIHVHGKVRIDRLDHTGIFNTEIGNYSHKLRVIKKIVQ